MSGLYIPNVSLPGDGDFELWISVKKDGSFSFNIRGAWQNGEQKIVSVADHGRLIDAETLIDDIFRVKGWFGDGLYDEARLEGLDDALACIDDAPTVIPADKEE